LYAQNDKGRKKSKLVLKNDTNAKRQDILELLGNIGVETKGQTELMPKKLSPWTLKPVQEEILPDLPRENA